MRRVDIVLNRTYLKVFAQQAEAIRTHHSQTRLGLRHIVPAVKIEANSIYKAAVVCYPVDLLMLIISVRG